MVAESVHLNFLEQKLFSAEIVHFNNIKTCQCRKCNHEKMFGCRNRAYFKKLTRGRNCSFFVAETGRNGDNLKLIVYRKNFRSKKIKLSKSFIF